MRILIADDHAVVRRGLREILLEEFRFAEIEEVGDSEELISKVIKYEWDVVLTDISMPGRTGLDALSEIKQFKPKLPVLILSIFPEDQYAIRALKAGAAGYLNKDAAPDELVIAIHKVLSGKKYITETVAEKLAGTLDSSAEKMSHQMLSDREFEVLKLLAAGKSISAIGKTLQLGVTTISTYRENLVEDGHENKCRHCSICFEK